MRIFYLYKMYNLSKTDFQCSLIMGLFLGFHSTHKTLLVSVLCFSACLSQNPYTKNYIKNGESESKMFTLYIKLYLAFRYALKTG